MTDSTAHRTGCTAAVEGDGAPRPVTPAAWAKALRPSRYCPSDQLAGFAATVAGDLPRTGTAPHPLP